MYNVETDGPDRSSDTSAESYEGKWESAGRTEGGKDHARRRLEEIIAQRVPTDPESDEQSREDGDADVPSSEADTATDQEQPDQGASDEG